MGAPKDANERRVAKMVNRAVFEHCGVRGPLIVHRTLTDAGGGATFLVEDVGGSHNLYNVTVKEERR